MTDASATEGRIITVTTSKAANGGTFVARHEGRVVFVRGAAPGETVAARVLPEDDRDSARFWRAEVIEVIDPSPDRVESIWPEAGTGGLGGADFSHIALNAQRRIKTDILQELLTHARLSTIDIADVSVEPAPGDFDGLGWRSRVRFSADGGRIGMRGWRSHTVHGVGDNPLAAEPIAQMHLSDITVPECVGAIDAVAPSASGPLLVIRSHQPLTLEDLALPRRLDDVDVAVVTRRGSDVLRGSERVRERVGEDEFELYGGGFWQIHRSAPRVLTTVVSRMLGAQEGETVWDLYGGAGLLSVGAARAVGESGSLVSVEGSARASRDAEGNLSAFPQASVVAADVTDFAARADTGADRIIMDPPRAGVGEKTIRRLLELTRQRAVYVSCEPSTLARDLRAAEQAGWRIIDFRAFDLFPHTHHLESVVTLEPATAG
ncbi:TRAM domain-containing protein [Helcobacillus massiliensis]|uniref:class I SAM-dependent RNA methyltransferase n=1 Tax=Helcobacillus massiliensis TaxID=521392 RepID=UPI0021A5572E|nr:TRAM domain-containing protein [Helcobacillus massiliensis]MCT1556943.1 TRAM domain-containing protein [Helcobacillus massiliensis]MCT2035332.1 TRAM domain-containing protein [Helcobacillus massiliensis]MCT2331453.1 TRAM domain-containing protein [Helcobacillus massiliensis]